MSSNSNHPVAASSDAPVDSYSDDGSLQSWAPVNEPPAPSGPNIQRYVSALYRFKWLILLLTITGGAAGYVATRFIEPEYEVEATLTVDPGQTGGSSPGITSGGSLDRSSWTDLLRSYSVADPVVMKHRLYLEPAREADSVLFRNFNVSQPQLRPGEYVLKVDGNSWKLLVNRSIPVDSGVLGGAIGASRGFLWQPPAQLLSGVDEVKFTVQQPREASKTLINRLVAVTSQGSVPFLRLTLTGKHADRLAATLNSWTEQFTGEAWAMKRMRSRYVADLLEGQRTYAERNLMDADNALSAFRVRTVTEPNERMQAVPGGLDMTTSGVMNQYFGLQIMVDNLHRDRLNLEKLLQAAKTDNTPLATEAIRSIPSVNTDPAAANLLARLEEQNARQLALRKKQETRLLTLPEDIAEQQAYENVAKVLVPRELESYVAQLRIKEDALTAQISSSGSELQNIPKRTIQEQQLKRSVAEAEALFTSLDMESNKARLADLSIIQEVQVRDSAVAPSSPTRNTAPVLVLGAIGAALALGIALAVLLDQTDKRFRYPEQATNELGLQILGVVPVIGGRGRKGAEQAAQVVETFRSIRMNVRYATEPGRALTLTISSPGPNDGKSLISSNLALSFAEAGARTLLIDGDIRRGDLSKTFGTPSKPGLVEYLDGTALVPEVLMSTASHPNLTVLPAGARRRRAPELLATPKLPQLIALLSREFDVIIVDSPPLGAGSDAFSLGTATGNMAIVLRAGVTDRRMAKAKLAAASQLPIRIIGAVLNSIKLTGAYEYYSYYQDYAAEDEESVAPRIAPPVESVNVPVVASRE